LEKRWGDVWNGWL